MEISFICFLSRNIGYVRILTVLMFSFIVFSLAKYLRAYLNKSAA